MDNVLSDLAQSCWIITLHLLGAGLLSLAWILMLRCVGGLMVWLSLLALIALLLLTVILSATRLYQLSHRQEHLGPAFLADLLDSKQSCWVSTILSSAVLGGVLLVVFVIRQVGRGSISHNKYRIVSPTNSCQLSLQRILMSVSLIQLAARAVADISSTLLFPLLPFLSQLVSNLASLLALIPPL